MKVGKMIKKLREQANLTALQLAKELGYSYPQFIYQLEGEEQTKIPSDKIITIMKTFRLCKKEQSLFCRAILREQYPDLFEVARIALRPVNGDNKSTKVKVRIKAAKTFPRFKA